MPHANYWCPNRPCRKVLIHTIIKELPEKKKTCHKQDISPLCSLCPLKQNVNHLHLLSCCTNKHITNLHTFRHNKAMYALANTLYAHNITRCFTLIKVGKFQNMISNNTIPSRLLPCTCYLPRCRCLAKLCLDTLGVLGTTSIDQPPCTPNPNLKVQNFEFIYCNDKSPQEAATRKLDKYDIL
jgi:hypothetical protein